MPKFRVIVDKDLCQGHSVCAAEAPEIFEVIDQGQVYDTVNLIVTDQPDPALYEKARRAEKLCPNRVITIEQWD